LGEALYTAGLMASNSGRPIEAAESLRRAIEISRADGAPDPKLSILYYQLAESESAALQHTAAEASAGQALTLALATNGENHVDTLRARMMLGRVLLESDRIKESLALFLQAKQSALDLLGAEDPFHTRSALAVNGRAQARAGELDQGLADSQSALAILRKHQISNFATATVLEDMAGILIELGRPSEAVRALDESRSIRDRVGQPAGESSTLLRAQAALDDSRPGDAQTLLSAFAVGKHNPSAAMVWNIKRDLLEATLELQSGNTEKAVQRASNGGKQARASELAPYLRSVISDSELLEGQARLRGGDADSARPILARALATRVDLYLPKSPKIAEAQLALAECELALGHRPDAAGLVAAAEAIEAQHSSLSQRYREPLRRLQGELAGATHAIAPTRTKEDATTRATPGP
jgi:serine/threonine-protein kinase